MGEQDFYVSGEPSDRRPRPKPDDGYDDLHDHARQVGDRVAAVVEVMRSINTALDPMASAMAPIGQLAQQRLDDGARSPVPVEVFAQTTPLWAVGRTGLVGTVIAWRWWATRGVDADVIPRVHCDPVVRWEGGGAAFDHPGVGNDSGAVETFSDRSWAMDRAADIKSERMTKGLST